MEKSMGIMPFPKNEYVQPVKSLKFITDCSHKRQKYQTQTSEIKKFKKISIKVES